MARYQIIETPGGAIAYPTKDDDPPLRNQEEVKIELARLRGQAKEAGRKIDFVAEPLTPVGTTSSSGTAQGSSVRVSEETRIRLSKMLGRVMMETGMAPSMGDTVSWLMDRYDEVAPLLKVNAGTNMLEWDVPALVAFAVQKRDEAKAAAEATTDGKKKKKEKAA